MVDLLGTVMPLGPGSWRGSGRTSVATTDSGACGYRFRGLRYRFRSPCLYPVPAAVSSIASAGSISSPGVNRREVPARVLSV
jgi:hypothetical protein